MLNFLKSNKKLPPFETLKNYSKKDFFFRRIASWSWLNDNDIFVIDPNASRFITMDPWPQKIFLEANGQITIHDYIYEITKEYNQLTQRRVKISKSQCRGYLREKLNNKISFG
jgi:hypothetical protein